MSLAQKLVRWKYVFLTYRDYASRLNRCVDVENVLMEYALGKKETLTREECRKLAQKLGAAPPNK